MRILMVTPELPSPEKPGSMAPTARQIESLRELGAEIDIVELKGIPKLKYLQVLPRVHARVQSADIVHAHYGFCGWLARTQFRRPVVMSFMGDDLLGTPKAGGKVPPLSKLVVRINRFFARFPTAIIVKSPEMAQVISHVPSYVIPNGVNIDVFRPMDRQTALTQLGWATDKHYILFPGNPDNPRKGFPIAQAAVEYAASRVKEPLELVKLWKVLPDQVPLYMNACEAMLMCSYIEGSPNVVKEAMACDLPVIGVPVGDVESLLEGVQGSTICARDSEKIGEALAQLLTKEPPVNGREMLLAKGLDLESVARKILSIYEEILSRKA